MTALAYAALQNAVSVNPRSTIERPGIHGYGYRNASVLAATVAIMRVCQQHKRHLILITHEDNGDRNDDGRCSPVTMSLSAGVANQVGLRFNEVWHLTDTGTERRIAIRPCRLRKPMKTTVVPCATSLSSCGTTIPIPKSVRVSLTGIMRGKLVVGRSCHCQHVRSTSKGVKKVGCPLEAAQVDSMQWLVNGGQSVAMHIVQPHREGNPECQVPFFSSQQDITDAQPPPPLPAGPYPAEIIGAQRRTSATSGSDYAQITVPHQLLRAILQTTPTVILMAPRCQYNRLQIEDTPVNRHRWRVFMERVGGPMGRSIDLNCTDRTDAAQWRSSHQEYEGEQRAQIARVLAP